MNSSSKFMIYAAIILVSLVLVLGGLMYWDTKISKQEAEDICDKLNMEIFDYQKGSGISDGTLTCYNLNTMELKKIR